MKHEVKLQDMMFAVRQERLQTITGLPTESFGIVREDTNQVIGEVSDRYTMVSHKQALEQILAKSNIAEFDKQGHDFRRYYGNEWGAYNNITDYLTHEYDHSFSSQIEHNKGLTRAFGIA